VDPLQSILGVKATHLLAGMAGGTVRAFLAGGTVLSSTASVVVGSLTAAYMTTPIYFLATAYAPVPAEDSTEHAVGFLVGLTAMFLCEGVLRAAKGWSKNPTLPRFPGDGK